MADFHIAALDIGTARARAVIADQLDDGSLIARGIADVASDGLEKSLIVDFPVACDVVRNAIAAAEDDAQLKISDVYLVLSHPDVRPAVQTGTVHITNPSGEVTEADIDAAAEAARQARLPPDRTVIHSIAQDFSVDGHEGILDPRGMSGNVLRHRMLILHGDTTALDNRVRCAASAQVNVLDSAFGGLCAALAALSPAQKAAGAVVIDLGAGSTSFVVYANRSLVHAGSLGIGGNHLTNDLAWGLRLSFRQAEQLKLEYGSALPRARDEHRSVSLEADGAFPARMVRLSDAHAILHARMDELLRWVRSQVDAVGALHRIGGGLVLTGGGARLDSADKLAGRLFNAPCVVGRPAGIAGLSGEAAGPAFASVCGMLRYAAMQQPGPPRRRGWRRWFDRLLGANGKPVT